MKNAFEFKTLAEFTEAFPNEETCRSHFAAVRFANGEYCAHCGHTQVYTFKGGKRYRCASCKKDFAIVTNTVFGETKLPFRKWYIAIYLLSNSGKGISSIQLAKHVGVTQKTGWFMDHRLRKAMRENHGKLFGEVEADETYVGGLSKNMHKAKRAKLTGTGGANKAIVMGLLERQGRIVAGVVSDTKRETLQSKVHQHVEPGSAVFTDSWVGYDGLNSHFAHESVDHQICFGKSGVHTNGIESFWAIFKRGYKGVYHYMSHKHLQRYVQEYTFRFNHRADTMQTIFGNVVANVTDNSQLPYKELTA